MKRKFALIRSYLVLVLLYAYAAQAQHMLIFDGRDDYAIVQHNASLNLNKENDFTIEFFIETNVEFSSETSLLSKHNGDIGLVCGISTDGFPFLRINNKVYTAEKALSINRCHHLAYTRKASTLYVVIDKIYYEVGQNVSNLSNKSDLVIGNSPNTSERFYEGKIDEIRWWNTYRSASQLTEFSEYCLKDNKEGLAAYWNIEEKNGQFINDLFGGLHAQLGNTNQSDVSDPVFGKSMCQEEICCDIPSEINFTHHSNHYVFTNPFEEGDFSWEVNGKKVEGSHEMNYEFINSGDHVVSLTITTRDGCKMVYSIVIQIHDAEPIEFCHEFVKTYKAEEALNDEKLYFDRFGNKYSGVELQVPGQAGTPQLSSLQAKSLSAPSCDCQTDFGINTNHFELYFQDCELGTGIGFDDPTASGSSTLGQERRRTICQVYSDLSQTILQNNATCSNSNDKVRVMVMPSQANNYYPDGSNLAPLPATVGGAASAFTTYGPKEGIVEVMPWIVLNTGADQQFSYNAPFYHGFLRINFSSFIEDWQVNHTVPVLSNKVDLYSVALHESMHMLGMASNLIYDGTNWKSRLTGTSIGGYSRWDSFIKRATGNLDVITNSSGYSWDLNAALLPGDLLNSCNGIDLWVGNNQAPLFSGTLSNYSPGSSLSHLDESCTSGSNFVLNPTISTGDDKRTLSTTELQLFADLGYSVAGYSNCVVTGVDDFYGNCSKTLVVSSCPGSSLNISTADLIANDINATGATSVSLLANTGNLQTVTLGSYNSDYILSPNVNSSGDLIIRYQPVGCSGQIGNTTYAVVQVIPCVDCSFGDLAVAQTTNSFIIDNGPNCGTSPSIGKCVDCGFNKNPDNLICNPEFCADNSNLNFDYSHFDCNGGAVTGLPGWYRAIATPGYVSPTINNAIGALYNDFATPLQPNSGYMHNAVDGFNESMYTDVSITPGERYFYSNYVNSGTKYAGANAELQVLMLSANYNVGTQFSCANSYNSYPPIYPSDYINVMDWDVQEHYMTATGNNSHPFDRNGSFVDVPTSFPGAYLLITNRRLQGNSGQVNIFVDQVELIEDDFSAGDDLNLTCGLTVDLGGTDFGMLSDVNVQYTWTNQLTGTIEQDYTVERELNGNLIVFDILTNSSLTQIPTLSVSPGVTTTYTLTRSFILDIDGTYGGLPLSVFNALPLTDDVVVNVPIAPAANTSFTHTINCNVVDFMSDLTTIGAPFSHSWDIDGDGNWDYFTENPSHAYAFNGTYNVIHEVSNGCGTFVSNQPVIITNNTLSLSISPSITGPFAMGDVFTADVTVENIGTATISNIDVEVPASTPSSGFTYNYSLNNIVSLTPGQSTVINVPVTVSGICGTEMVCAEIVSANSACLIPPVCSAPIIIQTNPILDQAIQVSNTITSTYTAPYVAGGLVEFNVMVTNLTSIGLNNIDLDFIPNGLSLIGNSPANFSLTANGSSSFIVQAKVLDCSLFSLESNINSVDDTCPGNPPTDIISGNVTPFSISVTAPERACDNSTGMLADVVITNPSNQTITDVAVLPTGSSNLFQNFSTSLSSITLAPNTTTTSSFTFDTNNNLGSAFVCASIETIGTGSDLINYSCANNQICTPIAVFNNPVTVTLTATHLNGNNICIYQNPRINYVLEITNNTPVPLNNMQVNSTLSGLVMVTGQSIPTTLSLPANGSINYIFGGDAQIPAGSADLTVDVNTNIAGCSIASASTSHPIFYTVNDVLSSTTVISTPGPYVYGQTIDFDVTVVNISPYPVNGIELNGVNPTTPTTPANSLTNMSTVAPFNLAANSSVIKTISATINNCNTFEFYGQITETASTCFGNLISTRILDNVMNVSGFTISMSPINTICDGQSGMIDVQVNNPTSQHLNVQLTATGASFGSLFSSLGSLSVSLVSGPNNFFSIPYTAYSGVAGTENICVTLDYACSSTTVQACEPASVNKDMEVFAYTMPINASSFCAGQYVNFISGFTNNSNVPVSITFNNILTAATVINNASLTGSATVNPGASHSITYVTTINNTGSLASLTSDYTIINATTCSGSNNYTESISVPVLTPLNQALTINSNITNTYPTPYVLGSQVEFEVTVENATSGLINNINLDFSSNGLTNVTSNPTSFPLSGGNNTTFLVTGTITDCSSFDLISQIASASSVCSSGAIIETVSGNVTPFGLSISSTTVACVGASGMQADITINNPSGQTISDVNLSALTGSTLFQNVNLTTPVVVTPGINIVNFTFDSNGSLGSENVCATINSIGQGANAIPYTCSGNQACDLSNITANPIQVSLSANPTDGTVICVDQNSIIDYTLTIHNPTGVDLTGLNITSVLSGLTLNNGQSIPISASVLAGDTETYLFSGTPNLGSSNASIQIDVANNLAGCLNSSVSISHPLYRDLANVLQVVATPLTSAPYTMGETIDYQVTVTNTSSNLVSNILMDYQFTGLINVTNNPLAFNLSSTSSNTFIVNATIDDCQFVSFSAELLSADQTCANVNPIASLNTPVTPYTVQLSGPGLTCSGSSTSYTVYVFNAGSVPVPNVQLTISGGSAFSGLPAIQTVTLQPGNNSITINATSITGYNGSDNLCVAITQIGSSLYNCMVAPVCQSIEFTDNPVDISIRRANRNLLCSSGTASFEVTITNLTNTDLTGINLAITGSTNYSSTNLPSNVNLLAGSTQVFIIDGNIPPNATNLSFCLDVTQITNFSCLVPGAIQGCVNNINVNNLSLPLEVEEALTTGSPGLSLEAIYDVALDAQGNMYGVGVMGSQSNINANGITTFTSSMSCTGWVHPFVFKYSNNGIDWVSSPHGCGIPTSIDVNSFGEVFVGLNLFNTLNFAGGTYTSAGTTDIAILKYSASGLEQAVLLEGGSGSEVIADLKVKGNKIFITGSTMALHPTLQGPGYTGQYTLGGNTYTYHDYYYPYNNALAFGDAFTASYSISGTTFSNNWISVIESPIVPNKIELDAVGNSYVVGVAMRNFLFPQILPTGGAQLMAQSGYANGIPGIMSGANLDIDAFVISYSPSGTNRWGGLYGSTSLDYPETLAATSNSGSIYHQTDIAISASGQLYVALQSLATYLGQPSGSAVYSFQQQMGSHIVNLNPANGRIGVNEWSVPAGSPVTQPLNGANVVGNAVMHPVISVDNDDNVFLSGVYNLSTQLFQTADFYSTNGGPTPLLLATPADEKGLVTEKFDINGNFEWADVNSTFVAYNGPYHPTFTPGNNPLRPLDLEVNACGIYNTVLMDGSMEVGGVTYNGTPYDGFVFRIVDSPLGYYYGRTANSNVSEEIPLFENESDQLSITIYPNPTSGRFTTSFKNIENNHLKLITIYNTAGIEIQSLNAINQSVISFDLEDQPSGMYYVKYIFEERVIIKPVILAQ